MIFFGQNKHLYLEEEDDATGAGGAPPAIADPPADPANQLGGETFTKKQKDADEAKLRRRYDREIKELKAEREKDRKLLEEIRAAQTNPPPDADPPPSDLAGRMELMEKRHERALEELRVERDNAKAARETEREKRLEIEKDRLLADAIAACGVDPKNRLIADRYFKPCIVWDELEEQWLFKTKAGNLVPVMDGVAEELPDNLKPSRLKHGGAGSSSGMPPARAHAQKELEAAEKKLTDLKEKARRNGARGEFMAAFRRQKVVVDGLRKALATKK